MATLKHALVHINYAADQLWRSLRERCMALGGKNLLVRVKSAPANKCSNVQCEQKKNANPRVKCNGNVTNERGPVVTVRGIMAAWNSIQNHAHTLANLTGSESRRERELEEELERKEKELE